MKRLSTITDNVVLTLQFALITTFTIFGFLLSLVVPVSFAVLVYCLVTGNIPPTNVVAP